MQNNQINVCNVTFQKFEPIGSRNPDNCIEPRTCQTRRVGVLMQKQGIRKAAKIQIRVPIQRSELGSRRTLAVNLNGAQAREVYEYLKDFFEYPDAITYRALHDNSPVESSSATSQHEEE